MKIFILPFLITVASAQVPDLETATRNIVTVQALTEAATQPQASCNHGQSSHHGRRRLDVDERVPVEKCLPDGSAPRESRENIDKLISDFKISFSPAAEKESIIASQDFHLFIQEFKKFPPNLMRQMAREGSRITLIRGYGVADDPAWDLERQALVNAVRNSGRSQEEKERVIAEINEGYTKTVDGARDWAYTSGAGGSFYGRRDVPTRIVVNHMYSTDVPNSAGVMETREEGSVNLFLHEHGHALDNFHRPGSISNSDEWKNIRQDPAVAAYLRKIFTSYEFDQLNEGFAEAFAYFYGCPSSQAQMRTEAPRLAQFLEQLANRNMNDFR